MPKLQNGSKGDPNPGSLDCESDILPLSHRAPQIKKMFLCGVVSSLPEGSKRFILPRVHPLADLFIQSTRLLRA